MEKINTKTKQNNNSKNNYEIESGTKDKLLFLKVKTKQTS